MTYIDDRRGRLWAKRVCLVIMVASVMMSACHSRTTPSEPGDDTRKVIGLATVEHIDILTLESFPVQIHVVAKGYLGDGCTTLGEITQRRDGSIFRITLRTERPADAVCIQTQIITVFEETLPLDVLNLPAGIYTVDVNGMCGSFRLDVDNGPAMNGTSGGTLAETQWRLTGWSISSSHPSEFTMTADFSESQVWGTSAVNSYGGSYTATDDGFFSVSDLVSTLMAGSDDAMRAEGNYFDLLQQARTYTVNGATLTLLDSGNNELLVFTKR